MFLIAFYKLIISVIKILITIHDNIYLFIFFSVPGWYNIRRTNLEHNFPRCNISQLGKQKFLRIYTTNILLLFFFLSEFNFVQFLIDIKSRFQNISNLCTIHRRNIRLKKKTSRLIAVVKKGNVIRSGASFSTLVLGTTSFVN